MKRYLALFLILIFLIPCIFVPASASSYAAVVDAIEDQTAELGEYLGVMGREIVDGLTDIWEAVCDIYTTLEGGVVTHLSGIAETLYSLSGDWFPTVKTNIANINSRLNSIYSYFFVGNKKTSDMELKLQNGNWVLSPVAGYTGYTCTGFQFDLSTIHLQFLQGLAKILNAFYDLFEGDTSASDKFEEDKAPLETQVDEWLEDMETAPTINIDDIETELDKVADFETDSNYLAVLSGIFLNEAFLMMFTWCVILAMLGFILYGKR